MIKIPTMNSSQQATSIETPPDCVPAAGPVDTVSQVLPFGELTWENFERLCHRLASQDSEVEHSARYGTAGQAQQGIDIFARKKNGRYDTWQAKRYKKYSPSKLKSAVTKFLKGSWAARTETFVIAVQASLSDTKIQDEIEIQTKRLKKKGVLLIALGGEELSERLRDYPHLVRDFFGRSWIEAFFGSAVDQSLLDTLDGAEIASVRKQLAQVYQTQFHLLDRGAIESNDLSSRSDVDPERGLLTRFTRPDILIRELRNATATSAPRSSEAAGDVSKDDQAQRESERSHKRIERIRRIPIAGWLTQSDQLALLGDAGTGKSTVLRCIALDLIGDQTGLPEIASRWGNLIPIYVSFAKWARATKDAGGQVGLKDVVRSSLQPLLTTPDLVGLLDRAINEHRILLLVDGLDEWSNEQAARTALLTLQTFVGTHHIPIVVTARPRGLSKIGVIPSSWANGTLAPLSVDQQRLLVLRCLGLTESTADIRDHPLNQVAERFFRELKREHGLATLAEIPLLLVSLLALAMRRITLPRQRAQALEQLIDILLEIHPQSRATAAGDVQARFNVAQDIEVRKGAIAALAFASRLEGGDAGYPTSRAKEKIQEFLVDPHTHAFPAERAIQAAKEILAVNAETIGLLVEKGPDEIGFVHASLEEYLSAIHIQSWKLEKLLSFVQGNATNIRWRNVIGNLVAITKRPTEIDQLVEAIRSADTDFLGESARNQLLTDIAFSPSKMLLATATELGQNSIELIEGPGIVSEREYLLSSVLNGTSHPILGPILLDRVLTWAPKSLDHTEQLYDALGVWDQASDLLLALKRGLTEQSRWGQRPAARAMAKAFGGDDEVQQWLVGILNGTTDLQTTGVVIEALILGWPSADGLQQVIADAGASLNVNLRLIAIWALVKLGQHNEGYLSELLDLLGEPSALDYWYRPLAAEALSAAWSNHPTAIERCIQSTRRHGRHRGDLDREMSINFLLDCSADNQSVRRWILDELEEEHPFLLMHGSWDRIAPFSKVDKAIKESLIVAITKKADGASDHQVTGLIAALKDPRLKTLAIQKVKSDDAAWSHSWYLDALLNGWPLDQDVLDLVAEIRGWPDKKLAELVRLLPKILPNHQECRGRLLAIHRSQKSHRLHVLPNVFADIGCDSTDHEVVDELLKAAKSDKFWGGAEPLIYRFSTSPSVQAFSRECLLERDPPLLAIAKAYPHVQEFRKNVLGRIGALPNSLRYTLTEVASIECEHHDVMAELLKRYDWEVDGNLKVLLSIRHYEHLISLKGDVTNSIETLLKDVRAVGPDNSERRAAATAGLITLGAMREFAKLLEGNKPLTIHIGRYDQLSDSLLELIARRWDELKSELGEGLVNRIGSLHSIETVWDALAPFLAWNNRLHQEFVSYCELTDSFLGIPSLKALAQERPNSDLLERHCLHVVESPYESKGLSPLEANTLMIESAYILRDQFGGKPDISSRLNSIFTSRKNSESAMILAIYDPKHSAIEELKIQPLELATRYNSWAAACTISAARKNSAEFVEVLRMMINRDTHSLWDFQTYTNVAVLERLSRDPETVEILVRTLAGELTNSEAASLPRYLVSIAPFDEATLQVLRSKLDFFSWKKGVAVAGYDAIADDVRPISHSLMDALR